MIAMVSLHSISHVVVEKIQQHLALALESSPAKLEEEKCKKKETSLTNIYLLSLNSQVVPSFTILPLKNQESCQGRARSLKDWYQRKLAQIQP